MKLSSDFTEISSRVVSKRNDGLKFPMLGGVPVAAIDFDGTLAEYSGWEGPDHVGKPRKRAIWALRCFKHNDWEVEIWTARNDVEPVRAWVNKYAPGLVQRINETRDRPGDDTFTGEGSTKPKVDVFIDDKDEYWFGRELDWLEIMTRLKKRGFLSKGLLPEEG